MKTQSLNINLKAFKPNHMLNLKKNQILQITSIPGININNIYGQMQNNVLCFCVFHLITHQLLDMALHYSRKPGIQVDTKGLL
jgi:hypothetical protein